MYQGGCVGENGEGITQGVNYLYQKDMKSDEAKLQCVRDALQRQGGRTKGVQIWQEKYCFAYTSDVAKGNGAKEGFCAVVQPMAAAADPKPEDNGHQSNHTSNATEGHHGKDHGKDHDKDDMEDEDDDEMTFSAGPVSITWDEDSSATLMAGSAAAAALVAMTL